MGDPNLPRSGLCVRDEGGSRPTQQPATHKKHLAKASRLRCWNHILTTCYSSIHRWCNYSPTTQPSSSEIFMSPHSCLATHFSQSHQLFQLSFSYMSASSKQPTRSSSPENKVHSLLEPHLSKCSLLVPQSQRQISRNLHL